MPLPKHDIQLLEAALIGFQHQRDEVERKIAEIRSQLGSRAALASAHGSIPGQGRRPLSEAARQRIAMAQKKRWAAYKSQNGRRPATKAKKRVLSAEGRARIIAATKKRWEDFRKAKQSR